MKHIVRLMLLAGLMMVVVSCGDPAAGPGKSAVFLIAEGDELYGIKSDVYTPGISGSRAVSDYADITIKTEPKDQSGNTELSIYSDVIIDEYTVYYYRADGNPNVPAPYTVPCHVRVSQGEGGFIETLVVPRDAKLKSPLKELAFGGGEGTIILTASITYYGEDLAGNAISTVYELHIEAADW